MEKNSFTYTLTAQQIENLRLVLEGNPSFQRVVVPYTTLAMKGDKLSVNLYTSGKLLVQGRQ
ncbi:MAG: DUF3378 domain-containing protein, partial [Kiritimatiellia bacterium]